MSDKKPRKFSFLPEETQTVKKALRFLETSDDPFREHKMVTEGIHAGDTAMGKYALMPKTTKDFAEKLKKEQGPRTPAEMMEDPSKEYIQEDKEYMKKRKALDTLLNKEDNEDLSSYVQTNPEAEDLIVNKIVDHIGSRTNFDPEKVIYNWEEGHNKFKTGPKEVEGSGRVKIFRDKFKNKVPIGNGN